MSEQMAGTVNQSNAWWLIESVDNAPTVYFCGPGEWCTNPHHAYKFAVRDAAEANRLSMVNPDNFKVTEHLF